MTSISLVACGGAGNAVPTAVEISWPDAAVMAPPILMDAGTHSRPVLPNDASLSSP